MCVCMCVSIWSASLCVCVCVYVTHAHAHARRSRVCQRHGTSHSNLYMCLSRIFVHRSAQQHETSPRIPLRMCVYAMHILHKHFLYTEVLHARNAPHDSSMHVYASICVYTIQASQCLYTGVLTGTKRATGFQSNSAEGCCM